jgi:hypothetical protein
MFATFPKNVGEKIFTKVQIIINKKFKKSKRVGIWDLNLLSGLFWTIVGFIVHILIHLLVGIYELPA